MRFKEVETQPITRHRGGDGCRRRHTYKPAYHAATAPRPLKAIVPSPAPAKAATTAHIIIRSSGAPSRRRMAVTVTPEGSPIFTSEPTAGRRSARASTSVWPDEGAERAPQLAVRAQPAQSDESETATVTTVPSTDVTFP